MSGGSPRVRAAVGVVGGAVLIAGAIASPARAADGYLVAYAAVVSIALGALSLMMIVELTNANWFRGVREGAAEIVATLPVLAVLGIPLILAIRWSYPWGLPTSSITPALRAAIAAKSAYLNAPFFLLRTAFYWASWIVTARLIVKAVPYAELSTRADAGDVVWYRRGPTVSAIGLPLLAFTMTFASFDWLMSLTPEWYSTIYGVYWFAGGICAALAVLAVMRAVRGESKDGEASRALGKLILTITLLWVYMGYSQIIVIWSADLPTEAAWYVERLRTGWKLLGLVLLLGHFAIPFGLLLMKRVRDTPRMLGWVGAWLLVMHYLDSYWLIMPSVGEGAWWGPIVDLGGLCVIVAVAMTWSDLGGVRPSMAGVERLNRGMNGFLVG